MGLSREQLAADLVRVGLRDRDAFARVYDATSAKLFGILIRILGRSDLAEEVLQDVYARVWERAAVYDPSQASPITWLATIARNKALDEVRRRQPKSIEDVPGLLEWPSEEDITAQYLAAEERTRLRECIDRLDGEARELLQYVYFRGATRSDIATRTGQSVSTIRLWLRRTLDQLKDCLGG